MPKPFRFTVGQTFHRLTITAILRPGQNGNPPRVSARCDCGKLIEVNPHNLALGNTHSCGCLKREQGKVNVQRMQSAHFDRECAMIAAEVDDRIRYYSV